MLSADSIISAVKGTKQWCQVCRRQIVHVHTLMARAFSSRSLVSGRCSTIGRQSDAGASVVFCVRGGVSPASFHILPCVLFPRWGGSPALRATAGATARPGASCHLAQMRAARLRSTRRWQFSPLKSVSCSRPLSLPFSFPFLSFFFSFFLSRALRSVRLARNLIPIGLADFYAFTGNLKVEMKREKEKENEGY